MLSPFEKAAHLLAEVNGDQREAEVLAWKAREEYGNPESEGFKFFSQVAVAIALGQEYPPIERKAPKHVPTPAFRGTEA